MTVSKLHFGTALLPQGWASGVRIGIDGGFIREVARDAAPAPGDERHGIGLPGMPNLHSHAFQRGFAGMAERRVRARDDFWSWRDIMYRFVGRITPDDLEAIAAQAFLEMLEGGFTQVGEFHYLHRAPGGTFYDDPAEMSARLAAAAELTGIGLTLLPVFYAHSGFGGAPPAERQKRFVSTPDEFARLIEGARKAVAGLDNAVVGIAPHSLRAVTPQELGEIVSLARGAPIHIHIAEQMREVEDCIAWCGMPPVQWLMDNVCVDRHWCLVHATHANSAERRALALSEAVAGLCPITEANLGDGIFPLADYLGQSGRMGIGSDSNILINAAEELRLLEYGQRLTGGTRNVAASAATPSTGRFLYGAALAGGAQALGIKSGLDVGCPADIIALEAGHASLACRTGDDLLDSYLFAGPKGAIANVWRGGKRVVSDGRHFRKGAVAARYKRALERLLAH